MNGVVMHSPQSPLHAISSLQLSYRDIVPLIMLRLVSSHDSSVTVEFVSILSHVGVTANETVDQLVKNACGLPLPIGATPFIRNYKRVIHSGVLLPTPHSMDTEQP